MSVPTNVPSDPRIGLPLTGRLGLEPESGRLVLSAELEQICGLSEEDIEGSWARWLEHVHGEDRSGLASLLDAPRDLPQTTAVFRFTRPDDSLRWLQLQFDRASRDDETSPRLDGTAVDVTEHLRTRARLEQLEEDLIERKKVERQLAESERRLSTLMSNLPGMAYRCLNDRNWTFVFCSEGCEELCGYRAEALTGREIYWNDLVLPGHRECLWETVQEAVSRRQRFEVEYPIEHADGSIHWMWEQGCGVFDDDELMALEGFITDITARRHAEEALREADRRKDQFLAMLGHELRNPLVAIRSAIDLLNLTELDDPVLVRTRDILERQSRQVVQLVDGIVDASRIARGKFELQKTSVDLVQLLRDLLVDRAEQIGEQPVDLTVHAATDSLWLEADPIRLRQVFDNLLMNAVKYSEVTDQLSLDVRRDGDLAIISVRDTGRGIPPEALADIFEPFQQAPRDLTRSEGGLGLGLALVKGIVEMHEGTIEAYSEGAGKGATFEVCLPILEAPAPESDAETATPRQSRCVLVIDDDPDVGEILQLMLERAGHEVHVAQTVSQGLTLAEGVEPDIVFCDLGIPEVTGYDFARMAREHDALGELPLIALTGYGHRDIRDRTSAAGFDDYLVKPVELEELDTLIERFS